MFIFPIFSARKSAKPKLRRKEKLGVEGVEIGIILEAFEKAGITASENALPRDITKLTLYELGLSGGTDSSLLRKKLQLSLGLPSLMSAASLIEVLNTMMTAEELSRKMKALEEEK